MRIAMMQPYFFPYIGYFQTIKNCDIYVNLDHVNFMKSSYMTRNILKKNNHINVEINNASSFKKCCDTYVKFKDNYIRKFKQKVHHLYSKNLNYKNVMELIINPTFEVKDVSISKFNLEIIKKICVYLNIDTKIIDSSVGLTDKKSAEGVIEIVKILNGNEYINSYGGKNIYSHEEFKKKGIQLFFIKPKNLRLLDPNLSILDILFTYNKDFIKEELDKFELI